MTYAKLRQDILDHRPDLDVLRLDEAYAFAKAAHEGQTRYSGEPYIIHPVEAARILLALNPDLASLQACLMHDVTEDTERTLEEIEAHFGAEVAMLVQGCEKLAVVKTRGKGEQDEKWKNMFLAMAKDVRIVFIKLADRLHNLRTLHHVPLEKQRRIANESLVVHAAIASRMGIYQLKSELEDLCFRTLYPEAYATLSEQLSQVQERSQACMSYALSAVEQLMFREGIELESVTGRRKHLWSLYQKMEKKGVTDLEEIHDLFAVRIVLPDSIREDKEQVAHLYSVLGLLHNEYLPLQDRFKDYVAVPKPNGYRSLHTTVLGVGGELYDEPTEIQIRTLSMHKEAELGVASHASYKLDAKPARFLDRKRHFALQAALGKVKAIVDRSPDIAGLVEEWLEHYQRMDPLDRASVEALLLQHGLPEDDLSSIQKGRSQEHLTLKPNVEQQLAWLRGLAEGDAPKSELDLYPNRIFVMTPRRDVMDLPSGATPLDFAYAVHTEVGNHTMHAKVNGRIVPLDYVLKNGEVVEVGTRANVKPSRYWLSIVKTASAKAKIKNWFNKQDKEVNIAAGRELLNQQLSLHGKALLDEKLSALKDYAGKPRSMAEREQLLEGVGLGSVTVTQILKTMYPETVAQDKKKDLLPLAPIQISNKVLITGEEDLPVVLSACCKPKSPQPIIGYVTRGRSIRVHRQSCHELSGLEGDRFVSAHWKVI